MKLSGSFRAGCWGPMGTVTTLSLSLIRSAAPFSAAGSAPAASTVFGFQSFRSGCSPSGQSSGSG